MALNTLKGKTNTPSGEAIRDFPLTSGSSTFISVDQYSNTIVFQIQDGPIKEAGVNGCQFTALIEVAQMMLEGLNEDFPCPENEMTIVKLKEALMWQEQRTKERERRGVEGFGRI